MKWFLGSLLLLGATWLIMPRSADSSARMAVEPSSRRVREVSWRTDPERERSVEEMERHAAELSDEELGAELEKSCDHWLVTYQGRKLFEQPRWAIMLAREIGKRNHETGMKRVATWLEEKRERLLGGGDDSLEMEFQFYETRVTVAGFAGWISDHPEEAISRLIESWKNEEDDWPVANMNPMFLSRLPHFAAAEEVLRDGFRQIAESDFERAFELFAEGSSGLVFDPNQVLEVLIKQTSGDRRRQLLAETVKVGSWEELLERAQKRDQDGPYPIRELEDAIDLRVWMPGLSARVNRKPTFSKPTFSMVEILARARPEEAKRFLDEGLIHSEARKNLVGRLMLENSENYSLLSMIEDQEKAEVIDRLIEGSQDAQFGPLIGREDQGAFDLELLRETIVRMPMEEDSRADLLAHLAEYRDER